MPFTFSHPALAIPVYFLRRNFLSLTGLVMGSLAPDFEYFIRMKKGPSVYSHSFWAIFWFNLPIALLLAFIFHGWVKKPLIHHLPLWLYIRLVKYEKLNWFSYFKRKWPFVLLSIVIGTATHLLWDWFTHYSVVFTNGNHKIEFTFLNSYFQIYTYTILHILNSLFGLVLLFKLLWQLPTATDFKKEQPDKWYWIKIFFLSGIIILLRSVYAPIRIIDDLAVITIMAFLISISFISFLDSKKEQRFYN